MHLHRMTTSLATGVIPVKANSGVVTGIPTALELVTQNADRHTLRECGREVLGTMTPEAHSQTTGEHPLVAGGIIVMAENLMSLSGITYRYPGDREAVINGLDLAIPEGAAMGLIAPNGSGKTTLFHLMMGLLKPQAGVMTAFGREVAGEKGFREVRRRVGLLFQDADDQLFSPTVLEDVAFGPMNLGMGRHEARKKAREVLSELGLSGYEDRITFRLSGGEKRMVSLATVLAMEPDLLLLDEPTTGLDHDTWKRLVEVLQASKVARLVISHDFEFLEQVTDSLHSLEGGKIVMDRGLHLHQHAHVHQHGDNPHHH